MADFHSITFREQGRPGKGKNKSVPFYTFYNLVKEALKYSGAKTKRELIHQALEEFVKNRRRRNLLDLAGKIEFAEGYDYKSLRVGKRQ